MNWPALDGSAQIYRVLGQLNKAIERQTQAIVILDRIDAKGDLAGAYAQRGLTYQKMGNAEQACQDKGTTIGVSCTKPTASSALGRRCLPSIDHAKTAVNDLVGKSLSLNHSVLAAL